MSSTESYPGWRFEDGIGYLPPQEGYLNLYDEKYYQEYVDRARSRTGSKIVDFRVNFVQIAVELGGLKLERQACVLDVGCGYPIFVRRMGMRRGYKCYGTDVNKYAREKLEEYERLHAPDTYYDILTFWDSLEHLEYPFLYIAQHQPSIICMTLPIFGSEEEIFSSKHFKPNEHIWYFTEPGLMRVAKEFGYEPISHYLDDVEIALGREGVRTYGFRKVL